MPIELGGLGLQDIQIKQKLKELNGFVNLLPILKIFHDIKNFKEQ